MYISRFLQTFFDQFLLLTMNYFDKVGGGGLMERRYATRNQHGWSNMGRSGAGTWKGNMGRLERGEQYDVKRGGGGTILCF